MAKIIAIANQKGGVGKTTTSINLASFLAVAEQKTLLIDLDPQGNASEGSGVNREDYGEANVYHALIGQEDTKKCIYETELPNFHVCPSDNNLAGAEVELVSAIARESKLKIALEQVSADYDYILIDCPPSLGLLTLNALNAAERIIVPLQTEFFAMQGLVQLLNTIKLVKNSINPKLELEGILLTIFDPRNNLHKQVRDEVRNLFGDQVFETIIPRNVKLSEAPSHGKPVLMYDIGSKGSQAYLNLATEFLHRVKAREEKKLENELPEISMKTARDFDEHQPTL